MKLCGRRADGARIFLSSLTLTAERLVEISGADHVSGIDGFTLFGSILQASTRDSYTTRWELDNGASLSVSVNTMSRDEALSWEFAATEPFTVLGDTVAFITRADVTSFEVGFQYPDTGDDARVTEFPSDTRQVAYTFGRDEIVDVIGSLRLHPSTSNELNKD